MALRRFMLSQHRRRGAHTRTTNRRRRSHFLDKAPTHLDFNIQSMAEDMAKAAMVRVHSALPEGARLIAMVHDEFIVECRQEHAEDVRALMVETMQTAPEGFNVLMAVEAKIADNWGGRIKMLL